MGCGSSSSAGNPGKGKGPRELTDDDLLDNWDHEYGAKDKKMQRAREEQQSKPKPPKKNTKKKKSRKEESEDEEDEDEDDDSSSQASGSVGGEDVEVTQQRMAAETKQCDEMWRMFVQIRESKRLKHMAEKEFFQHLGISRTAAFKICEVYGSVSNQKLFLDSRRLCEALRWGQKEAQTTYEGQEKRTSNKIVQRLMDTYDADKDSEVDFKEFCILVKMVTPQMDQMNKLKFWWRVAISSDGPDAQQDAIQARKAGQILNNKEKEAERAVLEADVWAVAVPWMTVARFLRDTVVSGNEFVKAGTAMGKGNMGNPDVAPSKVLIRVKKQIQDAGFLPSVPINFTDFENLVYHKPKLKEFGQTLDKLYDALRKLLTSGLSPDAPSVADNMRLKAFFDGKDENDLKAAAQKKRSENLEKKNAKGAMSNAYMHEADAGDRPETDEWGKYTGKNAIASLGATKKIAGKLAKQAKASNGDDSFWGAEKEREGARKSKSSPSMKKKKK